MKRIDKLAAQGDVLFIRVDEVPEGYKAVEKNDEQVVAHSETGHHHVMTGHANYFENPEDEMVAYLSLKPGTSAEIEHRRDYDTHETLKLLGDAEGETIFEIRRQREHTPEGWRRVAD